MRKYAEVIGGIIEIIIGIVAYEFGEGVAIPMWLFMLGGYHIGKGLYKEEI